jgi:hypothetical protein
MDEIPTKCFWMGEDIDALPPERLREIIRTLGRELDATRHMMRITIDMQRTFAMARSRF